MLLFTAERQKPPMPHVTFSAGYYLAVHVLTIDGLECERVWDPARASQSGDGLSARPSDCLTLRDAMPCLQTFLLAGHDNPLRPRH
ncbi:hypothetical protein T4B_11526 [Trichinella pseudospiralis]|uniref:Uncharacterized protein n=2 Tax=Trichinella pseudospiralis TaxID=6337 RepID=A0A0V1FSA8_TRIPS|nr:hypothetical protein T4E_12299 [Trichinella pseudospiralis]KRY88882.1 hypothetical protein T4D_9169 [Trichinella pseudospiralis]KRZ18987.1 hypothetical protein T4B_11526 [Trichinella pseudospiralis]KRZ26599.1 hypothetical protein T4C_4402 [Trichinella pseudospiralis]